MHDKTITVKSTGNIRVKPDTAVINISLKVHAVDYSKAVKKIADEAENIKAAIVSAGYSREDLKTTDSNVDIEYANTQNIQYNRKDDKKTFAGYNCLLGFILEIPFNIKQLENLLLQIAKGDSNMNFSVRFSVKDRAAVTAQLLEDAVQDAKAKAELLADAAGIKLGSIMHMEYGGGKIADMFSKTVYKASADMLSYDASIDIEPLEINTTESISITWELE
jgi:uncharacterized protein YggE